MRARLFVSMAALAAVLAGGCAVPSVSGNVVLPGAPPGEPPPRPPPLLEPEDGEPCPPWLVAGPRTHARGLTCTCPSGTAGSVWGSGVYTADSDVCKAAIHSGALPPGGAGSVHVKSAPGCPSYRGTSANGVTTGDYGQYGRSFYFPSSGLPVCATYDEGGPCPGTFAALPENQRAAGLGCVCPQQDEKGQVSGTGIYASTSSLCAAAVHAGVIPPSGGLVRVRSAPACDYYRGSVSNGVKSSESGQADESFTFPESGPVSCAVIADGAPCPDHYSHVPRKKGEAGLACTCSDGAQGSGAVFGTGVYSEQSSVCRAARHAGAIGASGQVQVQDAPGCGMYTGSMLNGVRSEGHGRSHRSFHFPAKGKAACPTFRDGGPCPSHLQAVGEQTARKGLRCTCEKGRTPGAVYGTGIYTADSDVCQAAMHAGALGKAGGMVTLRAAPGCPAYVASEKRGVSTLEWGAYTASFYFVGHGDGKCPAAPDMEEGGPCPAFDQIPARQAEAGFPCGCPAGRPDGAIYGTGIYTADSDICLAALHAGASSEASGAMVTVKAAPGCGRYEGTIRNGVESTEWGAYGASFYFVGHGSGSCRP